VCRGRCEGSGRCSCCSSTCSLRPSHLPARNADPRTDCPMLDRSLSSVKSTPTTSIPNVGAGRGQARRAPWETEPEGALGANRTRWSVAVTHPVARTRSPGAIGVADSFICVATALWDRGTEPGQDISSPRNVYCLEAVTSSRQSLACPVVGGFARRARHYTNNEGSAI